MAKTRKLSGRKRVSKKTRRVKGGRNVIRNIMSQIRHNSAGLCQVNKNQEKKEVIKIQLDNNAKSQITNKIRNLEYKISENENKNILTKGFKLLKKMGRQITAGKAETKKFLEELKEKGEVSMDPCKLEQIKLRLGEL